MFSSWKVGKLFGIDFHVHATFWLLPLFVLFSGLGNSVEQIAFDVLFVFAVFGCVALHEVGHALAAAAYGIGTRDITLYPVGGVASLERMPERPGREIAIALAGPAVNVVIAIGLLFGLIVGNLAFVTPGAGAPDVLSAFASQLLIANVFLCVFNLIPAFPMDGGRVLRALAATQTTRVRATEIAVAVSTVMAALFLVAGLAFAKFGLIVVAVVVWLLAHAELAAVRARAAHREFERRARDFFGWDDAPPVPRDTAADLAARRFTGLVWDETHAVWVQWVDGVPVRALPR